MGVVVNKSFSKVRKDIVKKSNKLLKYLQDNIQNLDGDWTVKQNSIYEKLSNLSFLLMEEINYLNEIEVAEYKRSYKKANK